MSRILKQLIKKEPEDDFKIELENDSHESKPVELILVKSEEPQSIERDTPQAEAVDPDPAPETVQLIELSATATETPTEPSENTIELQAPSHFHPKSRKTEHQVAKKSYSTAQKFIIALGLMIAVLYGLRLYQGAEKPADTALVTSPLSEGDQEENSRPSKFKDDEKLNRDAITQFQSGNFKIALEMFVKLVNRHPKSSSAHTNLGLTYFRLGQFAQAKKHLENAIGLNPKDVVAYNNLGIVVLKEGNTGGAIRYFQKAIEVNASFADSHLNLGKTFEQLGQPKEAVAEYRAYNQLITADPVVKRLLDRRIQKLNTLSRYFEKPSRKVGSL